MRDMQKTKKQLAEELDAAREKISDLETMIRGMKETEKALRGPGTHKGGKALDITDIKQPQAAIIAERDNVFDVLAATRDGVLVVNDAYDLLHVNEVLEETFGPWKGRKCYEYLSMGHAPCEGCLGVTAGLGEPGRKEWRCPKNHRAYEIIATSTRNSDGSRSRLHILRDITARTRAEEALQRSEQRFRSISENIPVIVYSVLPDQRCVPVFVSSKIAELTGYSVKEFTENPTLFKRMVHPDDREQAWEKIMEHRRKKTALDIEYRIVTPAGQIKWVANKASLMLDENGETTCINGFLEDITERKLADQQLHYQAKLLEHVSDAVISTDNDFTIAFWNQAAERLYGWRADEAIGKKVGEVVPMEYFGVGGAEVLAKFRRGGFWQGETLQWNRAGDALCVFASVTALLDPDGTPRGAIAVNRDITERKKIEMELARLASFPEHNPNPIIETDLDGRIHYINPAARRLMPDLQGTGLEHPWLADWHAVVQTAREDPSKPQSRGVALGERIYDQTISYIADIERVRVYGMDVTERTRAADDRRNQLEFLQTLMDTIPNPIFYKDTDQRYTGCNRAFEQFLGLPKSQIIGKSVYEIAPANLADQYFEKDSELLRYPGAQVYESRVRTGSGEVRDVIFSKATFAAPDGKVGGLLGVIVDITDLKRTQRTLELREELYRSRFENSPIANWEEDLSKVKTYVTALRSKGIHDFEAYFRARPEEVAAYGEMMAVTDANAAALGLFQCSTLQDLERLVQQHASHHTSEAFMDTLIAVSEGARSFAHECAVPAAGGRQVFLSLRWVVPPGSAETLSSVLFSALDITHLKEVETELRAAESKLRTYNERLEKTIRDRTERIRQLERQRSASEAHAVTGRLAARIAHEINNPLAGIKNSFLLVKQAVPKDHPRYEYVTLIEREIDRIALIVRKMFELYRDEKQVRHEVQVIDCLREVLTLSESSLREKEISVEFNAPDKPITADLPSGFLTQVILNLLRNAIDASVPHSTITISTDADAGEMCVKVKDEGQGISDEDAPHIFEPFFTTKARNEPGGLGLGLAVSRSMVEAAGGSITFETCPGKGTAFTVCLPTSRKDREVQDDSKG